MTRLDVDARRASQKAWTDHLLTVSTVGAGKLKRRSVTKGATFTAPVDAPRPSTPTFSRRQRLRMDGELSVTTTMEPAS